jgi:hypothetical protein
MTTWWGNLGFRNCRRVPALHLRAHPETDSIFQLADLKYEGNSTILFLVKLLHTIRGLGFVLRKEEEN